MHTILIATAFMVMILSPCVVAMFNTPSAE